MKNFVVKLAYAAFIFSLLIQPLSSEEQQTKETIAAGSKKLTQEEHQAIKQKRVEDAKEGNERDELVTSAIYLTTHPMASHGVYKTYFDRIELNDGSIWQVYYLSDRDVVNRWMYFNDQVIIRPGTIFDATDFQLVSQRTGEIVPVNLVEMDVIIGDPYFMRQRLWIDRINYIYDTACCCFYYEIRLNDGSIWETDSHDNYLASLMYPGDVVFVGVDESFGSPTYNILVHFNSLEYVHADCVAR